MSDHRPERSGGSLTGQGSKRLMRKVHPLRATQDRPAPNCFRASKGPETTDASKKWGFNQILINLHKNKRALWKRRSRFDCVRPHHIVVLLAGRHRHSFRVKPQH